MEVIKRSFPECALDDLATDSDNEQRKDKSYHIINDAREVLSQRVAQSAGRQVLREKQLPSDTT